MATYRVRVDGHVYTVEVIDPFTDPVRAVVEGEVFEVVVEAPAVRPSAPQQASPTALASPTAPAPQPERVEVAREVAAPPATTAGEEVEQILAPLPGTIVAIEVEVGEQVSHGQELCVLEAMKMNNPIRATRAGVVKEILVNVGDQVQHGTPLMTIAEV